MMTTQENTTIAEDFFSQRLFKPIYEKEIVLHINIPPNMLDNNILKSMNVELKKKFLNKCTIDGYIKAIDYMVSYKILPIKNEFKSPSPFFDVTVHATIVKPLKTQLLKTKLAKYCLDILRCSYGPIEIICSINNDMHSIIDKHYQQDKDVYILIEIVDFKYSYLDVNIKCIGNFLKICRSDEYSEFNYE